MHGGQSEGILLDDTSLEQKYEMAKKKGRVIPEEKLSHRLSEVVDVCRSDEEDYILISETRNDNHDAFKRLQEKYWEFVAEICDRRLPSDERRKIASKTGNYELEDLVSIVFERLWCYITKLKEVPADFNMRAWLRKVADNVCIDAWRRSKARCDVESLDEDVEDEEGEKLPRIERIPSPKPSPEEEAERREIKEFVDEVYEELRREAERDEKADRKLKAFNMWLDGYEGDEIVKELKCSRRTVYNYINYVKSRIRSKLREAGYLED